ncbi:hypothetical protein PR003_g13611 [Phytophthora rubi]|uniref:Uncharacterized protein n=1 Tax=Phytophthora rubi TaxID=129364 RepID=A0A6A4FGT8_9STRA|nr:hypothetical protein PR001_g12697 [Phytophthora rubi]KAE9029698.1 hypothetical protein PR002_g10065 [Phytophthora rubi]KAE9334243.1 hypothetical protein PR003_g13611 [Phytophthora rubi]
MTVMIVTCMLSATADSQLQGLLPQMDCTARSAPAPAASWMQVQPCICDVCLRDRIGRSY